jgi:hypothetical protein
MKMTAFQWRKAVGGLLLCAVLFLTLLPSLGWTWHRVLPEHEHVYVARPPIDDDEIAPTTQVMSEQEDCLDCTQTQIRTGTIHLPGLGMQVLGVVANLVDFASITIPPDFTTRVNIYLAFYSPPTLVLLDPPPTREESV